MPVRRGPSLTILQYSAEKRGQWTMEIPDQLRPLSAPVRITPRRWRKSANANQRTTCFPGRDWGWPGYNNNKWLKTATMEMEMENIPCGSAAWKPDSGNTTAVRGWFPPMDNGELFLTQVSPEERPTLLLTRAGPGEWAMENGGRGTPAAPRARDPSGMTNWAWPMRLRSQWNGQRLLERHRVSSERGSGPR